MDDLEQPKMRFGDRLKHAWSVFRNKDPITGYGENFPAQRFDYAMGPVNYSRPYMHKMSIGLDRTIAVAVYNRLSTDVTRAHFIHARVDENRRFIEKIDSGLNDILSVEANRDQTAQAFMQDLVMSMLDEGVIAVVPVDTTINPAISGSYDIKTMRIGKIESWYPEHVRVELFNEAKQRYEPVTVEKKYTAIIENPFYSVMNEPNSTLKRLLHKLSLLDSMDDAASSGKLDLIIQLPYTIKTEARRQQAEIRRKQIEDQLENTKYGIAYTDGTERITQLNRAVENNLMEQIQYLTSMLYSQLGLTEEILNGTASETAMLNYYNRTINVILDAIAGEFERKFLTKTARSQNQAIVYFRDPFALTPSSALADIADKFTRNEVLSPNDVRSTIGFKPANDPAADELRNRNISQPNGDQMGEIGEEEFYPEDMAELQNEGEDYEV